MDENFKFVFFLFFSSSLGSHTLATLLAELALKRQFGKDSRRGKQEDRGRRATLLAGIAFKRQRDKDFRYRSFFRAFRHSEKNRK